MEVENFATQLEQRLAQKQEESPTYRKASGVLASLLHATRTIPNFANLYANNIHTMALYITAGVFKLLKRIIDGEPAHEHNLDAYLLLLSMTIPQASPDALKQGGLLQQFRSSMLSILSRKDNSPLVTRLAVAVLSHSFAVDMTTTNFKIGEEKAIVLDLFERSVASPRSNALSKECSRLLVHLLKNNPTVSAVIAEQSKANLLTSLQDRKELYLANVKEVIFELPVRLINDICHRVAGNLGEMDSADPSQQQYLAQTYFFLQKMTSKLLPSTLQDLLHILVSAVPAGTQPQKVQLSYMQLLFQAILALSNSSQPIANKLLSPVLAVLIELLLAGQKIGKFAGNLLSFVINNCIRPSLWRKKQQEIELQAINLDENSRDFTKILCLLQGLLSSRFPNQRFAATILSQFISKLQQDAFNDCLGLIQHIVQYRSQLQEKGFRKIMQAILVAFGVQNVMKLYPLGLQGNIASQSFEEQNNLWLLTSLQKTERQESMGLFNQYLLPLLFTARKHQQNQTVSKQRKQGYHLIEDLLWRCLKVFTKIVDQSVNYEQVLLLIQNQLKRVQDGTLLQLAFAIESLANALNSLKYKSAAAEQLIKSLAGILELNKSSSKQVLMAIRALAKIAPPAYVKRVFDKNIEKLIMQIEQKTLTKEQPKNLKNLQILMAVNSSIDFCDPAVTTNFKLSREQLLLKLVTGLISTSGTFQKKGYKYICETLSAAPRSLYLQFLQLFEAEIKVQSGAKHHRLNVIGKLWSWLRAGGLELNLQKLIGFIKTHLPQILLSLREANKAARLEGVRLIEQFTQTFEQVGLFNEFIQTICAGLVGQRSEMKLSTLNGLAIVIGKGFCTQEIFKEILQIVLLLLNEKKQQLYKGVVQFCRSGILSLPVNKQKDYLPHTIQQLFEADEEGKLQHRSVLRFFLLRLAKKHGKETVEQMIPQAHRKMLTHAVKMENREKRKKKQHNIAKYQQMLQMKADQKQKEEIQSSDQENQEIQQDARQDKCMEIEDDNKLEQLDNTNNLLLKYDLEKQQFHFLKEQIGKKEAPKTEKQPDQITFDAQGMMVINERRRPRNVEEEEKEEENPQNSSQPLNFKKKSKPEVHQVKESGDTYKSARAGGDIKLKDRPQPYAFIQFNSKALNKRFKKRAQHVFQSLFEKKEGGLRGLKSRIVAGN